MTAWLAAIDWTPATFAIVGPFAVALACVLGGFWYRLNKARSDNELKHAMLERGMSAEEIERVMSTDRRKRR
jgi:hypothetical protein